MPVSLLKESTDSTPAVVDAEAFSAPVPSESQVVATAPDATPAKKAKAPKVSKFQQEWTSPRREAVESYLRVAQEKLFLRDWTITVDWSRSCKSDDAIATCTPMADSRHATVRLSRKFLTETPKMQTQILIHELVHCHLFALQDVAERTVEAAMPKGAYVVFNVALTVHVEMTVDALADAFAGLMPELVLPSS